MQQNQQLAKVYLLWREGVLLGRLGQFAKACEYTALACQLGDS